MHARPVLPVLGGCLLVPSGTGYEPYQSEAAFAVAGCAARIPEAYSRRLFSPSLRATWVLPWLRVTADLSV
jgi:hypothetical protein